MQRLSVKEPLSAGLRGDEVQLSAKHQLAVKGLFECKASESNVRCIQVKDTVKEVEDYLKAYSSARMDNSCKAMSRRKTFKKLLFVKNTRDPIMSRPLPPIPPPPGTSSGNLGPSNTRDTKIAALRLIFNAFKALEAEVNATFVNSLPRKWLSMNQTQRANNSIKNDNLAALYGKYHYEEYLIDDIYESQTQKFTIQASSSKALVSNNFQDSNTYVEEDNRTSNEFIADLNAEYHERALLENQKRFYKRFGRVPYDQSNNPPQNPRVVYLPVLNINHFRHFLDILQNYDPMDDEPIWAADHVFAPTPGSAITIPETANKFAIKGNHLTLVKGNQFDGRTKTDPYKHIHEFLRICDMFKYRDTKNEVVRLMMFPLSLTREAKTWLDEPNEGTIETWDELRTAFIS
ncbi:hypothetical protein Tco_1132639 [Tanacetum coccineum]|uniref:Reverse transcriptase domain-containing protein n=1 Tax=Tanacetum coccineum TaxID=301880 RepID=A0ABQ5JFE5_9ASTR